MCHGVSASCNLKTCWQKIPSLETIATKLKEMYLKAIEVKFINNSKKFSSTFSLKINSLDLIFLKKSPDYCELNENNGSLGTKGRVCTENINDYSVIPSCSYLCCKRGFFNATLKVIKYECNCKIAFCCRPICETCKKFIEENYCL